MKNRHPLRWLLIAFLSCVSLANAARASDADEAALKATFLKLRIVFAADGPGHIVDSDMPWRIVQASDEMGALGSRKSLMEGITDSRGEARLSAKQRAALFSAWQRTPQQLWLIHNSQPLQMVAQQVSGRYQITFVAQESKFEKQQREKEKDQAQPLNASIYTQDGFDPAPFVAAFEAWRTDFQSDLNAFKAATRKDPDHGRRLLEVEQSDALKDSFSRSIHDGVKGLSLRRLLIEATYSGDRRVLPSGAVIAKLLLSEKARPVGFGGVFSDDGKEVELWYMTFDDMSEWTKQDFKESLVLKGFSPAELPPYKVIRRNSWPALVFCRDANGKVKLYALSMELAQIIQVIFNAQIS